MMGYDASRAQGRDVHARRLTLLDMVEVWEGEVRLLGGWDGVRVVGHTSMCSASTFAKIKDAAWMEKWRARIWEVDMVRGHEKDAVRCIGTAFRMR